MLITQEENFAEMLENYENEQKKTRVKDAVIVDIQDETVFVDVGEKVNGMLPKKEIVDENGELKYNVGDEIPVVITKRRTAKGEAVLSHKMAINEAKRKEFLDKFNVGDVVEVTITELNKGGFVAKNDDGIEFFIPKSESALKLNEDNVGKKIEAKIIEIKKNGIVLSRKALIFISKMDRILILKILPKLSKIDSFDEEIISLYKSKLNLRKILLDMLLELLKRDKNKVLSLFSEFEKIGIPKSYDALKLERIKSGQNDRFFRNYDEILDELNQQNLYLKLKTLQYFSYRFQFTNQNILIDLYEWWGDDENVRKVLSFFIADLLNKNPKRFPSLFYKRITGNDNKDTNKQQYIDTITNYIEELNLKSKSIQTFLEKFEKHQVLLKLKQR